MKAKIILACYIIIICSTSHTMELVPLTSTKKNNFQITCMQDIPRLSLKDIRPCFNLLPEKERNELLTTKKSGISLAESFTFNIGHLPAEVQLHLLTFIMDGDELSAKLFYKAPLWYAQKRYHCAKKMIEKSSLTKQPIALLFRLPEHEQKKIIGIITPPIVSRLAAFQLLDNTSIMVDENTEATIQSYNKEIQEAFFANENIRTITDDMKQRCADRDCSGLYFSTFMGILSAAMIIMAPGLLPKIFLRHCFETSFTMYNSTSECVNRSISIISLITVPSCIIFFYIMANVRLIKSIKKEAQLINI